MQESKLKCSLHEGSDIMFFSLVDYRNNLYSSSNEKHLIEFYRSFRSRNELITWMRERPKGVANIHEIDGEKDIIVVIPTSDRSGEYAKKCSNEIYKGLHIIFVESGGVDEYYFNFAHNVNVGLNRALDYKPKWVIYSNDDMLKVDEINILRNELRNLQNPLMACALASPGEHHTNRTYFMPMGRGIRKVLRLFGGPVTSWLTIPKEIPEIFRAFSFNAWTPGVESGAGSKAKLLSFLFRIRLKSILNVGSFAVFNGSVLKDNPNLRFNEDFVNGFEDYALSLELAMHYDFIITRFKIGDLSGASLGGPARSDLMNLRGLRDIANFTLFDESYSERLFGK